MAIKIIYRTDDGKEFDTPELAKAHEFKVDALKLEIKEDLNKIIIKLKDFNVPIIKKMDSDQWSNAEYHISNMQELQDEFLCTLKLSLQTMIGREWSTTEFLLDYYNSSKDC